jgi:hypothetical protein
MIKFIKFSILIIRNRNYSILRPYFTKTTSSKGTIICLKPIVTQRFYCFKIFFIKLKRFHYGVQTYLFLKKNYNNNIYSFKPTRAQILATALPKAIVSGF